MYRLTVIAGPSNAQPARGSSFAVGSGSFSIGRHSQNQIVLVSGNVSKRHCVLVVDNTRVAVEDQGSANGTFVNGKLSAKRDIQPGDRISVGEFVLELTEGGMPALSAEKSNVVAFPNAPGVGAPTAPLFADSTADDAPMPKDILGKAKYHFDRYILPYFFGFNERYEWRIVIGSLFALYLVLNLFISLSPLMDEQERMVQSEIKIRAVSIARELAERNTAAIAAKADSKLDLGTFDRAYGVKTAVIIDMESRILAPAIKAGNYFQNPPAAAGLAVTASKRFRNVDDDSKAGKIDRQAGISGKLGDDLIVAIEPIMVLNPTIGKNEPRAMAVVVLDTTLSAVGGGELWLVYAHTLVLSIIIGLFIFYLIYRITLRPLQEMNRKVDQTLRGEHVEFKPSVYFSELDPLWDLMDSVLKRVSRSTDEPSAAAGGRGISSSDLSGPLRVIAEGSKNAVAILDEERKIIYLNPMFEEVTGVRFDASEGQALASVSRDQAFSSLISDLCDRAAPGTAGVSEESDFSGIDFQIQVVSFGTFGDAKCFVFNLIRKEE
jgi:PAS domain-containing protein